jgi:anti-sigma factor RsiW
MHDSERNMIEDGDIELLEAMLDHELSAARSETLAARLAKEPKLAAELEHLRAERKLRAEMFSSLEGGEEAVVERILAKVGAGDVKKSSGGARPTLRRLRYAMAAAACVVIGFLIGWMGATGGKSNANANPAPYQVEILDESGQVMAVQKFQSLEKAREFSNDLQQWQIRQERILNGQVTVHSDKF